jgi:hypothetical protein
MSRAAKLAAVAAARSDRLLADVADFGGRGPDSRPSVEDRLERALGPDLAERILGALSQEALEQLDAALTPTFVQRLAALVQEHDRAA